MVVVGMQEERESKKERLYTCSPFLIWSISFHTLPSRSISFSTTFFA